MESKKKNKILLINLFIALSLLIMSFSFTLAYFTYSNNSSLNFNAGKISFSFKNYNEAVSDFLIDDLVYVDYYNDVMNDKTNTLDSLITYYDLTIINESNVENVSISINLSLKFNSKEEANAIICQVIPYDIINDDFKYSTFFKNNYVKSDLEDSDENLKNQAMIDHKNSLLNSNGIVKSINDDTISFLLLNNENFNINDIKKYRLVFLADYDNASKSNLEDKINSFSHQYECKLKIKAGQSEEFK